MSEWISVDEQLPEYSNTIIVTNGKEVCVGLYDKYDDIFGVMCGKGKKFGVTYWQPLPEPPID